LIGLSLINKCENSYYSCEYFVTYVAPQPHVTFIKAPS